MEIEEAQKIIHKAISEAKIATEIEITFHNLISGDWLYISILSSENKQAKAKFYWKILQNKLIDARASFLAELTTEFKSMLCK